MVIAYGLEGASSATASLIAVRFTEVLCLKDPSGLEKNRQKSIDGLSVDGFK
jgi:hypothetical protein